MSDITLATGVLRDYAWGSQGRISRQLGWPQTNATEAELWLGAHESAPTALDGAPWSDLRDWQTQEHTTLPFLLKVLAADHPLSLQVHPTDAQAQAGWDREEAAGVARDASNRNYRDRFAKPELIVAIEDGFQAMCGFRPVEDSIALLSQVNDPRVTPLIDSLGGGLEAGVRWALSGLEEVQAAALALATAELPERLRYLATIAAEYPADPGIVLAALLNHVTLAAGECLWLPAGNVHAYMSGIGIELMGPSDNVLRGGLTPKHVDVPELLQTVAYEAGPPSRLVPVAVTPGVDRYRPADMPSGTGVPFELLHVTGDPVLDLGGASLGLVTSGEFTLDGTVLAHGQAFFVPTARQAAVAGSGDIYIATSH